jgi:molybdopterin-guanine dinucleotide biosynthesis protein
MCKLSESSGLRQQLWHSTDRVQVEMPVPPAFGKERVLTEEVRSSSRDGLFWGSNAPRIITISGANKDIGKSSLVTYLVRHCRDCSAMKVTLHGERPPGEAVLEEREPAEKGTDTARMLAAGASPVFWIRTTVHELAADLGEALSRARAPVVIVEGNSVLEYLEPDFAVFIMGSGFDDFKPSAFSAIRKAHAIVVNGNKRLTGGEILALEREIKAMNPKAKMVVVSELGRAKTWEIVLSRAVGRVGGEFMSDEIDDKVVEAIKAKAEEDRIACAVALKLAEELKVPTAEVGKAANALNVKIVKCSLGCF